ncbi:MAG: MFS transporter [Methylococcaceae bacterium]|nr:MFS transporter [Methylococcaceae bacterium]
MNLRTLDSNRPLHRATMMFYSLPHLTHAVVLLPMALFIPSFYSDDLALPLASVGLAIAVSRIFDVITDPLIGILSDRWQSPWGRRKPWLVAGTPLLVVSSWMIFVPRGQVSVGYLLVWTTLLYFAFTLVDLPYKAWGAELSTDYSERSRVTAWREGAGAAGQILFLGILMGMSYFGHNDNRDQLFAIALTVVLTVPPLMVIMVCKVPEREPDRIKGAIIRGWSGLKLVLENRAFLRTLLAILLFGTALVIQATLHKLVLTHVVGNPDLFAPMILVEHLGALLALPFWMRLSDRLGKHRAVTLAALWVGVWSLAFPLVDRGDSALYVSLIVLRGSSFTSIFFLSNSIAADVVDYDTLASGQQRTGLYFAVWGMAIKLSVAIGILLATVLPARLGFEPSTAVHSEPVLFSVMAVYGWLPFLIMILAFPLLWNFPITRERQRELRARIEAGRRI